MNEILSKINRAFLTWVNKPSNELLKVEVNHSFLVTEVVMPLEYLLSVVVRTSGYNEVICLSYIMLLVQETELYLWQGENEEFWIKRSFSSRDSSPVSEKDLTRYRMGDNHDS